MKARLPYVAATLVLTTVVLAYVVGTGGTPRPGPRLERSPGKSSRPVPPPPQPSARQILERGRDLGLRPDQAARLEALDAGWQVESGSLGDEIAAARRVFDAVLRDAQRRGGATTPELQAWSADYRALSAELRERRRRHADEALAVLSASQRRVLGPMTMSSSGDPR